MVCTTLVWPTAADVDRLTVTALAPWETRAVRAGVAALAFAAPDDAGAGEEADALEPEALAPEPPVVLELCARSATNHTHTNSANTTRTIWNGREIWVICP